MTNEELNSKLYEKIYAEMEEYRKNLLSMSPEEILEHAYAYTVREDIVIAFENYSFSDELAKPLLESEHPLEDIFSRWEDHEDNHMEELYIMIEEQANSLIRDSKMKANRDAR